MTYLMYSGATNLTGEALAAELDVRAGKTVPARMDNEVFIGWGSKTDADINLPGAAHVINHPNAIRTNRNKYKALGLLKAAANTTAHVANFVMAGNIIQDLANRVMVLPVIGRTNMHQGGKGFWFCPTLNAVKSAIRDGAQYFQSFIQIDQEYRLHVFYDKVIYAQKKVENASAENWVALNAETIREWAGKNNVNIDENTMIQTLNRMSKQITLPDPVIHGHLRGWKFSSVQPNNVLVALRNVAIAAVGAVGLNFGAVDCAIDSSGKPWIIEINSGPRLEGSSMAAYVAAFRAKIDELTRPVRPVVQAPVAKKAVKPKRARAAVGADNADPAPRAAVPEGNIAILMRNVRDDEDARALLDALRRGDI